MREKIIPSIFIFFLFYVSNFAYAIETEILTREPAAKAKKSPSQWEKIKQNIHSDLFSEISAPALEGASANVPGPENQVVMPANAYTFAQINYEFLPRYQVVYWQRFLIPFSSIPDQNAFVPRFRNPRFAVRRTDLFSHPDLKTKVDLFLQPAWGYDLHSVDGVQLLQYGFRTDTRYQGLGSSWSFGLIQEMTFTIFRIKKDEPTDFYGFFMPWGSFSINPTFAINSFITLPFQHTIGKNIWRTTWEFPYIPYIQNGVGITVSENLWVAFFINNYLQTSHSLKNTWASMWVSWTIL